MNNEPIKPGVVNILSRRLYEDMLQHSGAEQIDWFDISEREREFYRGCVLSVLRLQRTRRIDAISVGEMK
jgi:hypothetical protein